MRAQFAPSCQISVFSVPYPAVFVVVQGCKVAAVFVVVLGCKVAPCLTGMPLRNRDLEG
jgi:hypothetical protein